MAHRGVAARALLLQIAVALLAAAVSAQPAPFNNPGWHLLLSNRCYHAANVALLGPYTPLLSGSFSQFGMVDRSGYITCNTGTNNARGNWRSGGSNFNLCGPAGVSVAELLRRPSSSSTPVSAGSVANSFLVPTAAHSFFGGGNSIVLRTTTGTFNLAADDSLWITWTEARTGSTISDNGGTHCVDVYAFGSGGPCTSGPSIPNANTAACVGTAADASCDLQCDVGFRQVGSDPICQTGTSWTVGATQCTLIATEAPAGGFPPIGGAEEIPITIDADSARVQFGADFQILLSLNEFLTSGDIHVDGMDVRGQLAALNGAFSDPGWTSAAPHLHVQGSAAAIDFSTAQITRTPSGALSFNRPLVVDGYDVAALVALAGGSANEAVPGVSASPSLVVSTTAASTIVLGATSPKQLFYDAAADKFFLSARLRVRGVDIVAQALDALR